MKNYQAVGLFFLILALIFGTVYFFLSAELYVAVIMFCAVYIWFSDYRSEKRADLLNKQICELKEIIEKENKNN